MPASVAFFDVDNTLMKGYSGFYTTVLLIQKKILKKRRLLAAVFYRLVSPVFKGNVASMYQMAADDMAGRSLREILEIGRECFERNVRPRLYREGLELIERLKKDRVPIFLLTSGPAMTVSVLAQFLGIDGHESAGPVIQEGILQKELRQPICYREGKVTAAGKILRKLGRDWREAAYYADSLDDLPLLERVGAPNLVNPDRRLKKIGTARGWPIWKWTHLARVLSVAVLLTVLPSCQSPRGAERVARQFMQNYYVESDLREAQNRCDGLALQKVRESLALVEGQGVDESTRRPTIFFDLMGSELEEEEARFLFRVTIRPPDFRELTRTSSVKLRKRPNGWRVTQFSDTHE